jgi:hypothetical protein
MRPKVKRYLTELLHEKKVLEAITWYNNNVCKNYVRARKTVLALDTKLRDDTRYHIEFLKKGYKFHFFVEYYTYGTLLLTKSLLKIK